MSRRGRTSTAIAAALAGLATLAGAAVAASAAGPAITSGYYANLVGVPSATVEFHVRAGGKIPDLALVCVPEDRTLLTDIPVAQIRVVAPALTVSGGTLSYSGTAMLEPDGLVKRVGSSTLVIHAHHVDGPVHHYTFEGRRLSETTAWKGTVSSPACQTVADDGAFTLFGPVPGE